MVANGLNVNIPSDPGSWTLDVKLELLVDVTDDDFVIVGCARRFVVAARTRTDAAHKHTHNS